MGRVCVFIGHRDAPRAIWGRLLEAVESVIVHFQVTEFYVGGYGQFDSMAADAVRSMQLRYTEVRLYLIYAYLPVRRDDFITERYDGTIYPEGLESTPRRFAITKRNKWMVDQASAIIAYVDHDWDGAFQTLKYALNRPDRADIINLGAFPAI